MNDFILVGISAPTICMINFDFKWASSEDMSWPECSVQMFPFVGLIVS